MNEPATFTRYEALTPVGCLYTESLNLACAYVRRAGRGNLTEIVETRRRLAVPAKKRSSPDSKPSRSKAAGRAKRHRAPHAPRAVEQSSTIAMKPKGAAQ